MLVPNLLLFKCLLINFIVNFLEDVLEASIVFLQNRVLSCQVEWVLSFKRELKAAVSEFLNALVSIIHAERHSSLALEMVNLVTLFTPVISTEHHLESARLINCEVSGLVLISKGMSADNDGLLPARNQSWDVLDDDRLAEDGAVKDVTDGAIGTLPHFLEFELFDACFIRSDGGALDANFALLDCFGSFKRNFVFSEIPVLNAEIEVEDLQIEEGEDEFILNRFPNDAGHFIPVKFSNWIGHCNLMILH